MPSLDLLGFFSSVQGGCLSITPKGSYTFSASISCGFFCAHGAVESCSKGRYAQKLTSSKVSVILLCH